MYEAFGGAILVLWFLLLSAFEFSTPHNLVDTEAFLNSTLGLNTPNRHHARHFPQTALSSHLFIPKPPFLTLQNWTIHPSEIHARPSPQDFSSRLFYHKSELERSAYLNPETCARLCQVKSDCVAFAYRRDWCGLSFEWQRGYPVDRGETVVGWKFEGDGDGMFVSM